MQAETKKCPWFVGSEYEHSMRDNCVVCAPYWEEYPICPVHKEKLTNPSKGKAWCKDCRKHYEIGNM